MTDRSAYPTRKLPLEKEGEGPLLELSPEARLEMVWPLTIQAWEFATWDHLEGVGDESRLRRDVGRLIRPGR